MLRSTVLILSSAVLLVLAQDEMDLIREVFGNTPSLEPSSTPNLEPSSTPCPPGQSCVPYYLCKNGSSIITDGVGITDIKITEGSCANYIEVCCSTTDIVEMPGLPVGGSGTSDGSTTYQSRGCGYRNPDGVGFRLTGDNEGESLFGEFPWTVGVLKSEPVIDSTSEKQNVYLCGGALIHPKAVLTAAHCVAEKRVQGNALKIRAGEWDTQMKQEVYPHQDRNVVKVLRHPNFNIETLSNDVAILFLEKPVDLEENVDIVCLPPKDQISDQKNCFASGWGKDVYGKEGKYETIMKKVELPIVQNPKCQESLRKSTLGSDFELNESFICAGGVPGKDTCKGDGGSPLVCPIPGQEGRYYQAGIVAWGVLCGDQEVPGVYASVAHLRPWIDEQMQKERLETKIYSY